MGLPLQQEWELRDRYYYDDDSANMRQQSQQQYLVEELESDEDDNTQGMHFRDRTPTRPRELLYDGNMHEEARSFDDYYISDEERYSPPGRDREREEALMQSAYARIARAREKGKTNVNLTQEEMQALERGRMAEGRMMEERRTSGPQQILERRTIQQPELAVAPLATPPITPAAAISSRTKDKVKASSSRSSSAASLASQKKSSSRKSSNLLLASPPAKSNSKAKVTRKGSIHMDQPPPMMEAPLPQAPPGMRLINGPNGVPVYAPVDYYPAAQRMSPSASRSRSGSQHRRERDSVTPPRNSEYPPTSISTRYRPGSSSSLRDDGSGDAAYDWYGPPARRRSGSNARSYQNVPYGYEYGERPRSQQQAEHYSEPVRYASLRRVPPNLTSGLGRERPLQRVSTSGSSGSSGSEEQGVRVEVLAGEGGGYAVQREEEEEPVVEERKGKSKGKDLGKYGSVRKRKAKR